MTRKEFIKQLLLEQVYMPIQDEVHTIKGFQSSTKAQSLLVEDEERIYTKYPDSDAMLKDAWMREAANPEASIN